MKKETKPRGNSFRRLSYRLRKKSTSSGNDQHQQQQQQQQSEDALLLEPPSQSDGEPMKMMGMQQQPWRDQEMPLQRQMMELTLSSPTSRSSDPMHIVSSPCCSSTTTTTITSGHDQDTLTSSPGGLTCTITPSSSLAFFAGGGGGGSSNSTTTTVVTGLTNGAGDTWRQSNVFAKLGERKPVQPDNDTLADTSSIKSVASSGSLSTTSLGIALSTAAAAADRPLSTGSSSTSTPTLARRGYSSSVGSDAKPIYAAYHDGYLRPLNLDEFSHWSVPFCFICHTDCGPDYQYATSIRVTGSRFGMFLIGGTMRRDPFVYRQIYVCQPCDTVMQQNSPDAVVRLCSDAHAFFL